MPLGFPVGLNATKKWFIDQNGNPCFACGDAPQFLPDQLSSSDVELYLSDRAMRGMNLLWMIVVNNVGTSNPPYNANGDAPFNGADFTNLNSAYWNYIDHIMQRCRVYGITVVVMPAFMGLNDLQGYHSIFYNSSDAVVQGYASFLGTRYKGFPNLIWALGGDADPNNAAMYAKLNTFAVTLKAADHPRPPHNDGSRAFY